MLMIYEELKLKFKSDKRCRHVCVEGLEVYVCVEGGGGRWRGSKNLKADVLSSTTSQNAVNTVQKQAILHFSR